MSKNYFVPTLHARSLSKSQEGMQIWNTSRSCIWYYCLLQTSVDPLTSTVASRSLHSEIQQPDSWCQKIETKHISVIFIILAVVWDKWMCPEFLTASLTWTACSQWLLSALKTHTIYLENFLSIAHSVGILHFQRPKHRISWSAPSVQISSAVIDRAPLYLTIWLNLSCSFLCLRIWQVLNLKIWFLLNIWRCFCTEAPQILQRNLPAIHPTLSETLHFDPCQHGTRIHHTTSFTSLRNNGCQSWTVQTLRST